METKNNGGTFRSDISLTSAQEQVARFESGLRVRTLTLVGEEPKKFDRERSIAELEAIFGK